MTKAFQKYNPQLLLCIFLIVVFGLDILNKFEFSKIQPWLSIIKFEKIIFYIYFLILFLVKSKDGTLKTGLAILLFFFFTGQFLIYSGLQSFNSILNEITLNFRHLSLLFFPLIFVGFLSFSKSKDNDKLRKVFLILILIVVTTTFLGAVTNFNFFRTYSVGSRVGYSGLMPRSITATYFYISAIIFLYDNYFYNKNNFNGFQLFVTVSASLLVGTKAIYLFIVFLAAFHFFHHRIYLKKSFYLFSIITGVALILLKEIIFKNFLQFFNVLIKLYHEKGLLTAAMSYRDEIFIQNSDNYNKHWSVLNYLIGGKYGDISLFEISILDLITFFGFLGVCLYLYLFLRGLNHIQINPKSNFYYFSILSTLVVSVFAGQFFLNISGITYFIISVFLMRGIANERIAK